MAELKKCPFCSEEAYSDRIGKPFFTIRCTNIKCYAEISRISYEEAIEAWNHRETEADIRAKTIDELLSKMWLKLSVFKKSDMEYWAMLEDLAEQLKGGNEE